MAKVTVKLPEDLLMKFSKLASNSDAVAQKVLEAGGEVVLENGVDYTVAYANNTAVGTATITVNFIYD